MKKLLEQYIDENYNGDKAAMGRDWADENGKPMPWSTIKSMITGNKKLAYVGRDKKGPYIFNIVRRKIPIQTSKREEK